MTYPAITSTQMKNIMKRFNPMLLGILCLFSAAASSFAAETRPNILLMMADNWSWPHASVFGNSLCKTPAFDQLAREGVLFTHAFAPHPSCAPSRAAMLVGKVTHRLEDAANLWGRLPAQFTVYPDLLEEAQDS